MLSSNSPYSTRALYPKFRKTRSRVTHKRAMYNPYVYSSNDDLTLSLCQQKQELINEIRELSKEVEQLQLDLQVSESQYEQEVEKTTKTGYYSKSLTKQDKLNLEKFEQNSSRITVTESNIEELEMQIKLMKSLFSDENLEKIRHEVEQQKYEHECIVGDIQNITEETELLFLNINEDNISDKIQENMAIKSLVKHYKEEIKMLNKEGKELMKEAKELQENDPIDNNVKKLHLLRQTLNRIKRQRSIHERNATTNEKRNAQHTIVVETMNKQIEEDKKKAQREREKMNHLKENTDFNSHTLMPIESTIVWKDTKNDENFFEITQQQENIVPEEEDIGDQ